VAPANANQRGEITSDPGRDAASALRQFENRATGVRIRGGVVSSQVLG
jgi:hypothetical protein